MSILGNNNAMRAFEKMKAYSNASRPLEGLAMPNQDITQEEREKLIKMIDELHEMSSRMICNEGTLSVYNMGCYLYELSRDADFTVQAFMDWIDTILYVASFGNPRDFNKEYNSVKGLKYFKYFKY